MLLRLLLILFLLVWGLLWLRRLLRGKRPPVVPPSSGEAIDQAMVRCVCCGLHVPRSESVFDAQGRPYCCDEHRRANASH